MNYLYERLFKDITKAMTKLSNMILWLAKRTLTANDFNAFISEFTEKSSMEDEILKGAQNEAKNDF